MEEEDEASGVYRPSLPVENPSKEKLPEIEEFPNIQQWEPVLEMDDSQLFGASPVEAAVFGEEATSMADAVMEMEASVVGEEATPMTVVELGTVTEVAETSKGGGKRKSGRQLKVQTKAPSKKKEEEGICFICFDGGNLVLCDRRGCPKAYHPACVNRDEAFFRSKGRWNCGLKVHCTRGKITGEEVVRKNHEKEQENPSAKLPSMLLEIQVGIYVATVKSLPIICAIHVRIPCAEGASKKLI